MQWDCAFPYPTRVGSLTLKMGMLPDKTAGASAVQLLSLISDDLISAFQSPSCLERWWWQVGLPYELDYCAVCWLDITQ